MQAVTESSEDSCDCPLFRTRPYPTGRGSVSFFSGKGGVDVSFDSVAGGADVPASFDAVAGGCEGTQPSPASLVEPAADDDAGTTIGSSGTAHTAGLTGKFAAH